MPRPNALACLALMAMSACITAQTTQYLPQLYQVALVTEGGLYCSSLPLNAQGPDQNGGWVVQCSGVTAPTVATFNLAPDSAVDPDAFFEPIKTIDTSLTLQMRPGSGIPASIYTGGLVESIYQFGNGNFSQLDFALETVVGMANLTLEFGAQGSELFYLTTLDSTALGATKYCRVRDYFVETDMGPIQEVPSLLVCDLAFPANATRLRMEPVGWSWNYKRVQFKSVKSGEACGNIQFSAKQEFVTCDGGLQAGESSAWTADFSSNSLRGNELPMRSNAEFMMQNWIEYPLAISLWETDPLGLLKVGSFPSAGYIVPPGNKPYFSMLKNDGPSSNTTIGPGDRVLLRSSLTNKFCSVFGPYSRVRCNKSLAQVQAAPDRTIYQFTYGEFIPSDNR